MKYSGVSVEKEKSNINQSINTLINNQVCGCIVFTLRSRQIECTSVDSSLFKSNSQGGLTVSMLANVGAPRPTLLLPRPHNFFWHSSVSFFS